MHSQRAEHFFVSCQSTSVKMASHSLGSSAVIVQTTGRSSTVLCTVLSCSTPFREWSEFRGYFELPWLVIGCLKSVDWTTANLPTASCSACLETTTQPQSAISTSAVGIQSTTLMKTGPQLADRLKSLKGWYLFVSIICRELRSGILTWF